MMQLDLLAAPSARRSDPQTSRDAAESARELAARHHRIILDALSRGPAGKDRIGALTSLTGVQVCRRLITSTAIGWTIASKTFVLSIALEILRTNRQLKHLRWQAKIVARKVRHHIGYFHTPEEAHAAYMAAKARLHIGGRGH